MKPDTKRPAGFYWVRFEGQVIVAEYSRKGKCNGCATRTPHWHVPAAAIALRDNQVCELLSKRLEVPKVL
jgi:hypothetical protein